MKDFEKNIRSATQNPDADNRSWRSFVVPPEKTGAGQVEQEVRQRLYSGDFSSPDEQKQLFDDLIVAGAIRLKYQAMRDLFFAGGRMGIANFPKLETLQVKYPSQK